MFEGTDEGLEDDSESAVVDTVIELVGFAFEAVVNVTKVMAVTKVQDWPWMDWSMQRSA